jgi:hypothetical protein
MRFSGVYTPEANSPYGELTLASHKQIRAESGVQLSSSVSSSSLSTLFWQLASLGRNLRNLTEFLSAPNFSMHDLEGI